MKRFLTFEKRMAGTTGNVILIRVASVAVAVLITIFFLLCVGKTPEQVGSVLRSMFVQTFFTLDGLQDVLVKSIPLIITALGISIAFKMKLWNIGGEGQIAMGAFAAALVARLFPGLPMWLMLPAMAIAALLLSGIWASIAAVPRAYLGVNETITTLMLNYVALMWLQYLVNGPWSTNGFPQVEPVPKAGRLPLIPGLGDIHTGLVIALLLALAYFYMLSRSRWGYEIRVVGESPRAAEYAGINVRRNTMLVLMLSGAIAGLAGMSEVAGLSHRLEPTISGGFGYTAIIIAWLARLNPLGVIAMSIFMSALLVGGMYSQSAGISDAIAVMIQGVILFFVLGFDLFTQYKIKFHFGKKEGKA